MRVGIDATSWDNTRGFGRFARNVVEHLVALDPATTYVMLAPPAGGPSPPAGTRTLGGGKRLGAPRAATSARPPHELALLAGLARRAHVDAVLFPSVYTWYPTPGVPSVVGIHDAIAAALPGLTLPSRRSRLLWDVKERWAVRSSARIFTVSAAAQAVLTQRWGLPPERVVVVPEAPAAAFVPVAPEAARPHLEAVGLAPDEPFLVFAGGISPHKGLDVLLDALGVLRDRGATTPRLVVVGDLEDRRFLSAADDVLARTEVPWLRERVLLAGFVSDAALAALFSRATAVVLPSRAEGFGLPAVEAAACGAPLILSDVPAHRETLDGAALFAAVGDAGALAQAVERVLGDEALRATMSRDGRDAVAGLSWEAGARVLRGLLADVVARR